VIVRGLESLADLASGIPSGFAEDSGLLQRPAVDTKVM
jgi:hypothetical protein